jgi:glutamate synthase domain-containing protein 1
LEVPDAGADLDAVGVGLAVVGGLDEVHLRLLRGRTHGLSRLLRRGGVGSRGLAGWGAGAKGGNLF